MAQVTGIRSGKACKRYVLYHQVSFQSAKSLKRCVNVNRPLKLIEIQT